MTTLTLTMPCGPVGRHEVDTATLTPKAAALAEAIAQTGNRAIRIKSTRPLRENLTPSAAGGGFFGPDDLDAPELARFDGWHRGHESMPPGGITWILEYEARKLAPWWYPVADDGSDLPSSHAAAEDDLVDRHGALAVARGTGLGVSVQDWQEQARPGGALPAPVRHTVAGPLWSAAEVVRVLTERAVSHG